MADTTTTNYSITKPEVGGSTDTWGTKINAGLDTIDSTMKSISDVADAALTENETITISGDASGSGSTAITLTLGSDVVDGTNIADNSIDSEHYVDGSIDRAHLANDIINGSKIANDVINSEHYVAGSIDAEHLATNSVTAAKIAANAVGASELNVSGNGTSGQQLLSDGDGSFSWGSSVNTAQVAKAWVNFNGSGTPAIRGSYNISSITDVGTGLFRVNLTSAMSNTNYAVLVSNAFDLNANVANGAGQDVAAAANASYFRVGTGNTAGAFDQAHIYACVFGS